MKALQFDSMTGISRKQWLEEQFEFQFCDECSGDADAHICVQGPTGSPFARCLPVVDVVFRRFPAKRGGDVIALFPYLAGARVGECVSYQHIGQHGDASVGLGRSTLRVAADAPDVVALQRELESLGYRLRVLRRMPSAGRILASRGAR